MPYVVHVKDPADGSVHVYRFTNEADAEQFADVMRRLGGEVEIEVIESEEPPDDAARA